MSRRLTASCWLVLVMGLLLANATGCGGKRAIPTNEKVTQANADCIVVGKSTISEVEQLLGPGTEDSNRAFGAGLRSDSLKGMKWGPGKDGEEIRVVYKSDGQIAGVECIKWEPTK